MYCRIYQNDLFLCSHIGTSKEFVRRGPKRFYQIKIGSNVYLMHTKPCNAFGLGHFINAAIRVNGDIGKTYHKCLLRRTGQEIHVPNCEMIINHVKDRNLACPVYYKAIQEVTKPNSVGAHHFPSLNGDILR